MTTFKNLPPPPRGRDEIVARVGAQRALIYQTVRKILDDLEVVARWEQLYYPPTEIEEFLRIQTCLLALIEEIPYRTSEMSVHILVEAFKKQVDLLPDAVLDGETRQMVLGLLDPNSAANATASTRRIAFEVIDSVPGDLLADRQRTLLKWMIDRHAPEPTLDLSGEEFEAAIQSFSSDVIDDSMKEILGNIQFYFDGIHEMSRGDLDKLQGRIDLYRSPEAPHLAAEERVFTCEISADLKGKYSSAIMGAASNLVSEGIWNGAEVEPILFPEKAEEFQRNDQLKNALQEVLASIRNFSAEVPLVDLVASWGEGKRVDRYALSHLYGFVGNLGKLMKESSRRALYSGDYHQIQIRENRLANRINQINMLHNKTWEVLDENDPTLATYYPQMVDKAVELAAVLDVELLKKVIGGGEVKILLQIVSMEGEKRKEMDVRLGQEQGADYRTPESEALRGQISLRRQSVIHLLYDEDLQTFLELLLGSVLKRASFAVQRRRAETGEIDLKNVLQPGAEDTPPSASEILGAPMDAIPAATLPAEEMVHFEDLSVLDVEVISSPASTQVTPPPEFAAAAPPSPESPSPESPSPESPSPESPSLESPSLESPSLESPFLDFSALDSPMSGALDPSAFGSGEDLVVPSAAASEADPAKLQALEELQLSLREAMTASHPRRKSFDLVHRLLTSKGMIPPAMMQSIQPFLENLTHTVVPQLSKVSAQGDMPITYQSELLQYCKDLSRRDLTPRDMQTTVLNHMQGLLNLLGDVDALVLEVVDAHAASLQTGGLAGDSPGDGFLSPIE